MPLRFRGLRGGDGVTRDGEGASGSRVSCAEVLHRSARRGRQRTASDRFGLSFIYAEGRGPRRKGAENQERKEIAKTSVFFSLF